MKVLFVFLMLATSQIWAQDHKSQIQQIVTDTLASKWYEKIQLKGYSHFRYNRLGETNKDLNCLACDKSIGDKQGFFMRRARLTFFGEVSDKVYIYIQPDYSTDALTNQNYFQLRDAYFDYALSDDKEFRVRLGISKVPYGFDNLQSSSNRAPLDRDDAFNTGVANERDTGVFLMYAPTEIRKRFKELTSNNLKGTGDYGMVAIGAYNGQTLNKTEKNNDLHRVARFTYPFKLKSGQFIEASVQAYEGKFNVAPSNKDYYDQRSGATLIVYPQPIGFQLEYNIGRGPEYDAKTNDVDTKNLKGGYAQINYQTYYKEHRFFPYVRFQEFEGARKLDNNATAISTTEWEIGSEWQPNPSLELTAAYAMMNRASQSGRSNKSHEDGSLIRLQAQFNY